MGREKGPGSSDGGEIEARAALATLWFRDALRGFDHGLLLSRRLLRGGICPLLMESIVIDPVGNWVSANQMMDSM